MKKLLLTLAALAATTMALPFSDRITLPSGEKIFVSGFNLAWINFGGDVGDVALNETAFRSAMKAVADSGGNTMRVWLSTNGAKDPKFGADGLVSGLGTKTIANVQKMLAIAKENKMLLLPVLLTHNFLDKNAEESGGSFTNNKKMLTTDAGIKAYIDNALVPLVKAISTDPNLLAWEICNECEGMAEGIGWTTQRITKGDIQKITNRMTGAIKRAVPGILVSTGTVQANYLNWYSDAELKAAGADADGTMDFYMLHFYGWNTTANSPFKKSAAAWSMDKPIVVGEFASSDWNSSIDPKMGSDAEKIDTLLDDLLKRGYAGGLFWQYQPESPTGSPWMKGFATAGTVTAAFARAHKDDVTFDGISDGKFSVVASATAGGTLTVDPAGRVASGSVITLVATAAAGYEFTGWSGDTSGTLTTLKVTVNKDRNIQAIFTPGAGTNLIKGGTFTGTESSNWTLGVYPTPANAASVSYANNQASVTITATDATNYGVQIRQAGIQIDSGVTYVVTFDAFASPAHDIAPTLTTGDWNWQSNTSVSLSTSKTGYSVELKSDTTTSDGMLQFCIGETISSVTIDNVTMVRKGSTSIRTRSTMSSAALSLRTVANGLEWVRSAPLSSSAVVRVVDLQGHELYRTTVKAGSTSGFVPSVGTGLRFVVLESAQARDVRTLTSTR